MLKVTWIISVFLLIHASGFGQSDSLHINLSAYGELYYLGSGLSEKPSIFYNHTSAKSPALNVGMVELSIKKNKLTFEGGLMAGTYVNKNLAQEPIPLKYLYQLNFQYQVNSSHQLMVGLFPSHLGLENVKNIENDYFSRSYLAENSPYYETGLSWTYQANEQIKWRALFLTGWQHIATFNPALGSQFTITKNKWSFNSSQFLGNEGKGTRFFINNYSQISIAKNLTGTICFDWGVESGKIWHGELLYLTWKPVNNLRMTTRWEHYMDPKAVIISNSFDDSAWAISVDYKVFKHYLLRSEFKNSNKFGNEWMIGMISQFSLRKN